MGAQQWQDQIGRALDRCDWFLVLLSPAAVRSRWVKLELAYAVNKPHYEERIIPVLARNCDHRSLSWTLSIYQFVDFTTDFEKGCRSLLTIWGLDYHLGD